MERTLDEIIGHLISLTQDETETQFKRGALCAHMIGMGCTAEWIAGQVNCSASLIRELRKTYAAFPEEDDRFYSELSFYHYRLAAGTTDPHYWMNQAAENEWSTRELREAISGEKVIDALREAERVFNKIEKIMEAGGRPAEWLQAKLSEVKYGSTIVEAGEAQEEEAAAET